MKIFSSITTGGIKSFDKILLDYFDVDKAQIGMYAACYKLALFITLFSTAFKLGIEPFIFSIAKNNSAEKAYALILEVFVILGSFIFNCDNLSLIDP